MYPMNNISIRVPRINCKPMNATLSPSICKKYQSITREAYECIVDGKTLASLNSYQLERLALCSHCPRMQYRINTTFLDEKARTEIRGYIEELVDLDENVILDSYENQLHSMRRYYTKHSKAEERQARALEILTEHPREWVIPSEYDMASATFDGLTELDDQIVSRSVKTHKQCIRKEYCWMPKSEK